MDENKIVLCGANAYEKKYYFNEEQFKMIPDSIKQELHVICVLFTEEVGGVFTIAFEEDGNVVMETNADDDDIYYDEISSGLLISEIRRSRQELFESLSLSQFCHGLSVPVFLFRSFHPAVRPAFCHPGKCCTYL